MASGKTAENFMVAWLLILLQVVSIWCEMWTLVNVLCARFLVRMISRRSTRSKREKVIPHKDFASTWTCTSTVSRERARALSFAFHELNLFCRAGFAQLAFDALTSLLTVYLYFVQVQELQYIVLLEYKYKYKYPQGLDIVLSGMLLFLNLHVRTGTPAY